MNTLSSSRNRVRKLRLENDMGSIPDKPADSGGIHCIQIVAAYHTDFQINGENVARLQERAASDWALLI